jgi:signal transduction histidine kinase/CheY-like chemotaxis protein/HAMP domain-containing protein
MQLSLRAKLLILVAVNALALLVLLAAGSLIAQRDERNLNDIREQHVPRVALRPRLQSELERLQRSLQDAAAAADRDLLRGARAHRDAFAAELRAARNALPPSDQAALLAALDEYDDAAHRVSEKMIDGDTGPELAADVELMQAKRARVAALLDELTAFDEAALGAVFDSADSARRTASRLRLLISGACLLTVLALSLWISRGVFRRLGDLTDGFTRFGEGGFDARIPVRSRDEIGAVAERANEMAASLQRLGEERSRLDWIKTGRAGLALELRGELEPEQVAERSVAFLARYLGAPVGAIYYAGSGDGLRLLGGYALPSRDGGVPAEVARGEGLVGQAARTTDVTVVEAPDDDHLRLRSGVAEGAARAIVLVPLLRAGAVTGVLELAMLGPWTEQSEELVVSVRDTIEIAIEVARGRAATRALLAETTAQAQALEQQRVALEVKSEQLAAASRYKSQFLANMSHELRTPLNAIIGFAELMHDGVVTTDMPQHKEFLGDILTSGRHLLQLINDVLDLSKVEAGRLEFRPEPIDLESVIREVLAILRTTAAEKRITVESASGSISGVVLDPARLKQVLYNYVSNALKFTPEGGRVSIRASAVSDEEIRIEVEDTGIGISAENIGRLFAEFQQLNGGGGARAPGTGLGLALTKRLVEAQGGRVGVRSQPGVGSVFFAVLPRRAELVPVAAELPIPVASAGAPSVLVIEDNAGDQAHLVDALSRGGYSAEVASTGAQAIARCRERTFDAITLDVLLPDMSGLEVLRRIRGDGLNRDVPIIVITVVAEPGAVAGFAVHDLLAKPLQPDALLQALERCGASTRRNGPVLVVDDDDGSLRLMAAKLEQLGYQTACAQDGESALAAARAGSPSAIVLDLMMPGMNGFEFLDRLRSDPSGRTVPVIVWTVMDLTREQQTRLRASAQAVVSKGNGGSAAVVAQLQSFLPHVRREA